MSLCAGNCAGGHYTTFTNASLCPSNTAESKYKALQVLNWGTLAASIAYNVNVTPGNLIKDNDILEGLVNKVYNEIYRYTQNPRHNTSGGEIYFSGSALPAPGTPPFSIPDYDHSGNIVNHNIWQYIVNNARALQTAYSQTVSLDAASTDATDQINASYINEIVQVLNNLNDPTGCGTVCRCNVVCNCNGDCACNYSDKRLKEFIQPITETTASELLYNINTYEYHYKQNIIAHLPDGIQYGVMAQDLIELGYEEFINTDKDGYYSVNYQMMIPLMISEMQKTKNEKTIIEERLTKLEKHLARVDRTFSQSE